MNDFPSDADSDPDAMDVKAARRLWNDAISAGLSLFDAQVALEDRGFDEQIVAKLTDEYIGSQQDSRRHDQSLWRIVGILIFLLAGSLFVYFIFFWLPGWRLVVLPLLAVAVWGLLKAFDP